MALSWLPQNIEYWLKENEAVVEGFELDDNVLNQAVNYAQPELLGSTKGGKDLTISDLRLIYMALYYLKYGPTGFTLKISVWTSQARSTGRMPKVRGQLVIGKGAKVLIMASGTFELDKGDIPENLVKREFENHYCDGSCYNFPVKIMRQILASAEIDKGEF